MSIGTRLRQLRKTHKLSGDRLGELVGVSKGMVSQWENNSTTPPTDRLIELHKHLNFSFDWLLTGNGSSETSGDAANAVREFAWVYHNANEAGRVILGDAINMVCKLYVETDPPHRAAGGIRQAPKIAGCKLVRRNGG